MLAYSISGIWYSYNLYRFVQFAIINIIGCRTLKIHKTQNTLIYVRYFLYTYEDLLSNLETESLFKQKKKYQQEGNTTGKIGK